jgi:hypothetical protein
MASTTGDPPPHPPRQDWLSASGVTPQKPPCDSPATRRRRAAAASLQRDLKTPRSPRPVCRLPLLAGRDLHTARQRVAWQLRCTTATTTTAPAMHPVSVCSESSRRGTTFSNALHPAQAPPRH